MRPIGVGRYIPLLAVVVDDDVDDVDDGTGLSSLVADDADKVDDADGVSSMVG